MSVLLAGPVQAVALPDQETGLARLVEGNPITFIPLHAELSAQQSAELLHYTEAYQKAATAALDEMAAEAQRLGLYE